MLRKVNIDAVFVDFMFSFLSEEESTGVNDRVNGLSELFFEVVSGHGDELHSKGDQFLAQILSSGQVSTSEPCRRVI